MKNCKTCSRLKPMKIKVPSDLINCIDMIKGLLAGGAFERAASNFELEQPRTTEGYWIDDIMYYSIRCKECGQVYSCSCDTFHGKGRFDRGA